MINEESVVDIYINVSYGSVIPGHRRKLDTFGVVSSSLS